MTRETPYVRVGSLPFQRLKDEILVVDPKNRRVHLLNATATRVWELLGAPLTEGELVARLGAEFDAPAEALRADVAALLDDLGKKGLVAEDAGGAR